ncbi:DUF6676 family protein [Gordonia zhaorongruii]|uniref:Rv1476 family membrane protein n=1 Tax=Gordonia zhaorongruii TaxID=2597659 RepID=UPI0010539E58|nr:DUF6676 family protein [Gordonia zhaorongruii]
MSPEPVVFTVAAPAPAGGSPAETWDGLDLPAIAKKLEKDGVWAPADQASQLKKVVADARADGHDVHFVVLDQGFSPFTVYRDIAHELQSSTGGTVVVFGPGGGAGTASTDFSRVELEDATNAVTNGASVPQAARELYDGAAAPNANWTLVSIALIVVVIIAAVIARFWTTRVRARKAPERSAETAAAADATADQPGRQPFERG